MPTYEYRCPACHHDFEKIQRMADEPKADCPVCGQESQRRLSAGAGLLFKGSGFYITDYRSDSYKKAAGSDSGGSESSSRDKGGDAKGPAEKGGEDKPTSSTAMPESKSTDSKEG